MFRIGVGALLCATGCQGLSAHNAPLEADVPAEAGSWLVTSLMLERTDDVDGDGVVDNQLLNAVEAVDLVLADDFMSPAAFNERLVEVLEMPDNRVVMETEQAGSSLLVEVLAAAEDAGELQPDWGSAVRLDGTLRDDRSFVVGPSDLTFQVIARVDLPPVLVPLDATTITGELGFDEVTGTMMGVVPVDPVIDRVIAPTLYPYDIDGDGVAETPEEILDLIRELAPALSDVTLPDGTLGVSAALSFVAERR
jgi:hypothetical protein